jgi:hypothetical protein
MLSLFLQALLVNDRKLFRGPVTREITELGEHLLLVVHALAEMKELILAYAPEWSAASHVP